MKVDCLKLTAAEAGPYERVSKGRHAATAALGEQCIVPGDYSR